MDASKAKTLWQLIRMAQAETVPQDLTPFTDAELAEFDAQFAIDKAAHQPRSPMTAAADYLTGNDETYNYTYAEADAWLDTMGMEGSDKPTDANANANRPTPQGYCACCGRTPCLYIDAARRELCTTLLARPITPFFAACDMISELADSHPDMTRNQIHTLLANALGGNN